MRHRTNLLTFRIIKAKNHLPLVYFNIDGIYFHYILKNFDVKSLKDISAIDIRYLLGHLNCILPLNLPRYIIDVIELDKIAGKQEVSQYVYKEALNSIPIRG